MHLRYKTLALAAAMTIAPVPLAQAGTTSSEAKNPVVSIDSGKLMGVRQDGLLVFKGIPYATPPVGDLRWRPPAPAQKWRGVREALAFGADCEQTRRDWDTGRDNPQMSEDCLTVNVWAPEHAPAGGWPVMFWIHGGSLTAGSSAQPAYNGARLASLGIVVVTINYRLGRFGFFAHPALTREANGAPVGNFGLMDQIAALNWVKRNIKAFGGDASNVTIFGESAGGGSVNRLMFTPTARGLFQRAIAQSGGGRERSKTLAEAEAVGKAFAVGAGVNDDDPTALRALPVEKVRGGANLENEPATFSGVMLDGQLLTEDADRAFEAGHQVMVPYLAGSTGEEEVAIPVALRPMALAYFLPQLENLNAAVTAAYPSKALFERHVMGDAIFGEPARHMTRIMAGAGSYLYTFDYVAEAQRDTLQGAPHAHEVQFVFGTLETLKKPPTKNDWAISKAMMDYWTQFARTGHPGSSGAVEWPAMGPSSGRKIVFAADGVQVVDSDSAALDALAARYKPH